MKRYSKLIVAAAGLLAVIGQEFLTPDQYQLAVEVVLGLATAFGVYAVSNEA